MGKLKSAVESGDKALFCTIEQELRLIVALTKDQIRAGIIFRVEADCRPCEKMVCHLSTLQPGLSGLCTNDQMVLSSRLQLMQKAFE